MTYESVKKLYVDITLQFGCIDIQPELSANSEYMEIENGSAGSAIIIKNPDIIQKVEFGKHFLIL